MITINDNGTVTFRIYIPHAGHVELLADFSHWERGRLNMHAPDDAESGWWEVTAEVPRGDHSFSYLVDGHCWMPDYAASGVRRNEYGNWVSLLCMNERARRGSDTSDDRLDGDIKVKTNTRPFRDEAWRVEACCPSVHPIAG